MNTNATIISGPNSTTTAFSYTHTDSKPEFFVTGIALVLVATHLLNHIGYIIRSTFMALMAISCTLVIILRHWDEFITVSEEER